MSSKRNRGGYALLGLAGAVLLYLGGFRLTGEKWELAGSLCIGLGAAFAAIGLVNLLCSFLVSAAEDDQLKRRVQVERADERNIRIREKTGYMTGKIMNYALILLVFILGFLRVDRTVIILAASLLLLEGALVIGFSNYYSRRL